MPNHPTHTAAPGDAGTAGNTPSLSAVTAGIPDESGEPRPLVAPPGYELLEEIGSGGMGVVYRARELALNRHVAVKILHDRFPGGGPAAARFVEEAQITGQLQHPGIPPVHQVGMLPGSRPFLVMKLIKGRTLEDDLKDRADPAADRGRFLAIFERVCQAVACAHDRKVIHRDLKPSNVMVGAFGEVQVMDWGLAKLLTTPAAATENQPVESNSAATEIRTIRDSEGSFTQAGSVLGTPAFMPPEQAGGEIGRIDERSDVFGLGAILCVILTGKPVYVATDGEAVRLMAIRGQLDECMARLDACGAEPELLALCKRCLASDPSARPRHAGEVATAVAGLRAAAEDRAKRAELERTKAEVKTAEQRKRRKVQAALGLAFTGLVVLGAAFAWWVQEQRHAKEAEARERRAVAARDVNQGVEDAMAKFGRATGAGRDPALWAEARVAALQARTRAADADAPPDVRERIDRLLAEIEQLGKNRQLVATLLEIQASMGDEMTSTADQDFAGADARYTRAFQDYGTDLFALSPEKGAELLKALGGDVRVELAAAIDDWGYVRFALSYLNSATDRVVPAANHFDDTTRLFHVTRLLDPDPMRNKIREIVVARDHAALNRLAEEIDPAAQPVQTVNLVGVYLYWFRGTEDLTAAIRFAKKAHPHHPGDFQINFNLAFWMLREKRYADSIPYCLATIAVRPKSATAWKNYAWALEATGKDAEAIAAYRRTGSLSSRCVFPHLQIEALLTKMGDRNGAKAAFQDAVRTYHEAIRLDPSNAAHHFSLGLLWRNKKEWGLAIDCYREAVRLDPKSAQYRHHLGVDLRQNKDYDGAIECFKELIEIAPQSALFHTELAYVLRIKKDLDAALVSLREARRLDPSNVFALYTLGITLRDKGDLDGALEALREAKRLEPAATYINNDLRQVEKQKTKRDAEEGRSAPLPRAVKKP